MGNDFSLIVNGDLVPAAGRHVSALDRGFTLGDGVFETIRVARGRPFQWTAHVERLKLSAAVLGLVVPLADDRLADAVSKVLAANHLDEAVIRLTVARGVPSERGLMPVGAQLATYVVQASPYHTLAWERAEAGLSAHISTIRRNDHSPLSRIKSCNYLDNVLAKVEAHRAGADEAIMLNTKGEVACASSANLCVLQGDTVRTPSRECGVLAGITRTVVHRLALASGLDWQGARLSVDDLLRADEVFLTNSVVGVVGVSGIAGQQIGGGRAGRVTKALAAAHEKMVLEGS